MDPKLYSSSTGSRFYTRNEPTRYQNCRGSWGSSSSSENQAAHGSPCLLCASAVCPALVRSEGARFPWRRIGRNSTNQKNTSCVAPPVQGRFDQQPGKVAVLSGVEVGMDEHRVVAKHRLFLEREHVCDVHSWNGKCRLIFLVQRAGPHFVLREKYAAA